MIRCDACGGEFGDPVAEVYHYEECGLPHVYLDKVTVRRCRSCDNYLVTIPAFEALHRVIARVVAERPGRLSPEEIRFLRKELGWSGTDFAEQFGVTRSTVSRWENGSKPMGAVAERLLRVLSARLAPVADYTSNDLLRSLRKGAERRRDEHPVCIHLDEQNGWDVAAA